MSISKHILRCPEFYGACTVDMLQLLRERSIAVDLDRWHNMLLSGKSKLLLQRSVPKLKHFPHHFRSFLVTYIWVNVQMPDQHVEALILILWEVSSLFNGHLLWTGSCPLALSCEILGYCGVGPADQLHKDPILQGSLPIHQLSPEPSGTFIFTTTPLHGKSKTWKFRHVWQNLEWLSLLPQWKNKFWAPFEPSF